MERLGAGEMVWKVGEPVERVVLVAKGQLEFVSVGKDRGEE